MGRHRTPSEKVALRARALELRAAGRSRRQIAQELGVGADLLTVLLAGTTARPEVIRHKAKDDLREAAVQLRLAGRTYDQIAAELGVSKGSCSLWLRDLPKPQHRDGRHVAAMSEARWGPYRQERDAAARQRKLAAANSVGAVSDETLLLIGAVAYWCEGAKSKPWRRQASLKFCNSDPGLILLHLRWLQLLGVTVDGLSCRLQIHESADIEVAEKYWQAVTGLPPASFQRTTLKRHKPLTNRRNTGTGYHGCLTVVAYRSGQLLEQVEGLVEGILRGAGLDPPPGPLEQHAGHDILDEQSALV